MNNHAADQLGTEELSHGDISDIVERAQRHPLQAHAKQHQHTGVVPSREDKVAKGHFGLTQPHSGLQVHTYSAEELRTSSVDITLTPGLSVGVVLAGTLSFNLNGQQYKYTGTPAPEQFDCFAINVIGTTAITRQIVPQPQLTKVVITASHDWINTQASHLNTITSLTELLNSRLQLVEWQSKNSLKHSAHDLLAQVAKHSITQSLFYQSSAIALLASALEHIGNQPLRARNNPQIINDDTRRKLATIQHYVNHFVSLEESSVNQSSTRNILPSTLSLPDVAHTLGMSTSSFQRFFKAHYGTSFIDYVRFERLKRVRDAIEHQGLSLGEAAFVAGYKHTSNFSAAFKRAFGYAPGKNRARPNPAK